MEPIVITCPAGSERRQRGGQGRPGSLAGYGRDGQRSGVTLGGAAWLARAPALGTPRGSSAKFVDDQPGPRPRRLGHAARSGPLIRCPAGLWKSGMR